MAWGFLVDPTTEDAANVPLDLNDGSHFKVLADPRPAFPTPDLDLLAVSSADTEGEPALQNRYHNREITFTVRLGQASAANFATQAGYLQQKAAKITKEGGTLKVTWPSGFSAVFDLISLQADVPVDQSVQSYNRADIPVRFVALPFARGAELSGSDHVETSLPCL